MARYDKCPKHPNYTGKTKPTRCIICRVIRNRVLQQDINAGVEQADLGQVTALDVESIKPDAGGNSKKKRR